MIFDAHSDALFGIIHYPEKNLLESWPKEYYGILNYYFKGTESYDSFLFILEKISQLKKDLPPLCLLGIEGLGPMKSIDDLEKLKINYSLKEKMIKDIQKINQQLKKDEDTYQRYLDLYNLASGKNNARVSIERYVLATYFENMLIYANVIMKQLSQGRYQLLRKDDAGKGRSQQGLELDVFDQESGNIRSIKTLSGGESFKAALSLALGLSRMVQDYAGGIELNTLFIDEGFGSLDSQSLDQAMNCLMELHHENKLIGIISHVSDLKDRIERQLVVERKQKQSVIQMI